MRPIGEYHRVEYLLIARDHLAWIPPSGRRAVIGFNPFKAKLGEADFSAGLDGLLSYDWLPVEGKDFRVQLEGATVTGVTMQSEVFYPM